MSSALLIARLVLAAVFAVAGIAKLTDRAGSRQAIVGFGLPATLASPLAVLLPLGELALAAALIPTATAWWGALGALVLLLLFVAGIALNLARGRKPDCHCFGQLHSAPAGWATLARNGVLAAVAGFLVWQATDSAGPSVVSWVGALSTGQLVGLIGGVILIGLLLSQIVQWWFLVDLVKQNGRLLVRLEELEGRPAYGEAASENGGAPTEQPAPGLQVGTPAPPFSLSGLYGETITLDALRALGKPVMLLFTDPDCGPCTALLPEIGRWQQEHSTKLTVSLISRGSPEDNRTKSAEHGLTHVLLQRDWEVSDAYEVTGTPAAVLVRSDGTIGSPLASGSQAIQSLVEQVVGAPAPTPTAAPTSATAQGGCPDCGNGAAAAQSMPAAPKIGDPAPTIKLPDLSGKTINLAGFKGSDTLVLFWNPACKYCTDVLSTLKTLESSQPKGAPKLLVVSSGTVEENKAMGLRSPVTLDQKFAVGYAYGVKGTPSGVLVDANGNIASGVAVGGSAALALAGANQPTV
ncbi:MAG: redoxin domain-containing protein [Rubrobacter sp.]|nr:redoxin domain-containing protein [Rubrobacter sp.]